MIIRVLTLGQYKLEGSSLAELDAMDDSLLDAITAGDEAQFAKCLQDVVRFVESRGIKVPDDELVGIRSDHTCSRYQHGRGTGTIRCLSQRTDLTNIFNRHFSVVSI